MGCPWVEHAEPLQDGDLVGLPAAGRPPAAAGARRGSPRRCGPRGCRPACGRPGRWAPRRCGQDARSASARAHAVLRAEYISHCGWSKPMWQVWQACGCAPPSSRRCGGCGRRRRRRCRGRRRPSRSSWVSASLLRPSLWQPPQPFIPSMTAMRLLVGGGHGLHGRPGDGVLALPELLHLRLRGTGRRCRGWGASPASRRPSARVRAAVAGAQPTATWEWLRALPVGDDARGAPLVAGDAGVGGGGRRLRGCGGRRRGGRRRRR